MSYRVARAGHYRGVCARIGRNNSKIFLEEYRKRERLSYFQENTEDITMPADPAGSGRQWVGHWYRRGRNTARVCDPTRVGGGNSGAHTHTARRRRRDDGVRRRSSQVPVLPRKSTIRRSIGRSANRKPDSNAQRHSIDILGPNNVYAERRRRRERRRTAARGHSGERQQTAASERTAASGGGRRHVPLRQ